MLCVLMARLYGMGELGAVLGLAKSSPTGLVDRTGPGRRPAGVDGLGGPEVAGRHRTGGRRWIPAAASSFSRASSARTAGGGARPARGPDTPPTGSATATAPPGRSSTRPPRRWAGSRAACVPSSTCRPHHRPPADRDRGGRWIGGSVGQWVEEPTGAVPEHGAAGFMLFAPDGGTVAATTLGRWATEVAPAVREAVASPPSEEPALRLSSEPAPM